MRVVLRTTTVTAAVALALMAPSAAHAAVTITPLNTQLTGVAVNATFTTFVYTVTCQKAFITTTTPAVATNTMPILAMVFANCSAASGLVTVVVTTGVPAVCAPTLDATILVGAPPTGSSGTLSTQPGPGCITLHATGLFVTCTITVTTSSIGYTYVNATTVMKMDANNNVNYTGNGGTCGTAGVATFTASFDVDPNTIQVT